MTSPTVHRGSASVWYTLPLLFVSLSWLCVSAAAPRTPGMSVWTWPLIHLIRCMRPAGEDNVPPVTPAPQSPAPSPNGRTPGS